MIVHDIDKARDDFDRISVELTLFIAEEVFDMDEIFYEDFEQIDDWLKYYAIK